MKAFFHHRRRLKDLLNACVIRSVLSWKRDQRNRIESEQTLLFHSNYWSNRDCKWEYFIFVNGLGLLTDMIQHILSGRAPILLLFVLLANSSKFHQWAAKLSIAIPSSWYTFSHLFRSPFSSKAQHSPTRLTRHVRTWNRNLSCSGTESHLLLSDLLRVYDQITSYCRGNLALWWMLFGICSREL